MGIFKNSHSIIIFPKKESILLRESMQSNFPLEETSISMVINGGFAIAANPPLGSLLNFITNEYEPQQSNLYLPHSSPFSFFPLISIFYIHFIYVLLSLQFLAFIPPFSLWLLHFFSHFLSFSFSFSFYPFLLSPPIASPN